MIIVAVTAGLAVYAYVNNFVGMSTRATEAPKSQLRLDVADATAAAGTSPGSITAWIRNVGGAVAELQKAYIVLPNGGVVEATMSGTLSINPQEVQQVTITPPTGTNLQSGYVYNVRVICKDGSELNFNVRAHA